MLERVPRRLLGRPEFCSIVTENHCCERRIRGCLPEVEERRLRARAPAANLVDATTPHTVAVSPTWLAAPSGLAAAAHAVIARKPPPRQRSTRILFSSLRPFLGRELPNDRCLKHSASADPIYHLPVASRVRAAVVSEN
jgi:hypothetical protein